MSDPSSDLELRGRVLLCLQTSLLGMVDSNLRAVTADWDPHTIRVRMYFDGEVTEAQMETASDIEGEVMASFPGFKVSVQAHCAPIAVKPPMLRAWAFLRRE